MPDGAPVLRPLTVSIAAGLGFVLAAYTLVYALLLFTGVSIGIGYAVAGTVFLVISGLAAGGSVRALNGRGGGLLVAAAAVFTGLTTLGLVAALLGDDGAVVWALFLIAVGVAVVVLLLWPQSRAFFAAVRERR